MPNLNNRVTMMDIMSQLTSVSSKVDTLVPKRMVANVTKHGDVVETDGILSNFSSTNFASIPIPDVGTINSYEMVIKCTSASVVSGTTQAVVGYLTNSLRCPMIYLPSKNQQGKIRFYFSTSRGPSYEYIDSNFAVQADTTYWLKMTNEGTRNSAYYSLDGVTYTLISTVVESLGYNGNWSESMTLGNANNNYIFNGTIDLNECYIKINDEMWWTGMIEES